MTHLNLIRAADLRPGYVIHIGHHYPVDLISVLVSSDGIVLLVWGVGDDDLMTLSADTPVHVYDGRVPCSWTRS